MPMRREEMEKWAKLINGKLVFDLIDILEEKTLENIDYNRYMGRVNKAIVSKPNGRNLLRIYTDKNMEQFHSDMEVSSDGKMLIDTNHWVYWAIILDDKELLKMKSCNLCLSKCKHDNGPCGLFDSVLQIYTKGVVVR